MDNLKPQQVASLHHANASVVSQIIGFDGIIYIVAGNTRLVLLPGSDHYNQLKHKLSDFGCDHVAKKLQVTLHISSTQTDQTEARH